MKSLLVLIAFLPLTSFAAEPAKEDARQNVQQHQEASMSISPLIEKLTAILDAQEAKKKKDSVSPEKEVESLLNQ